MQYKQASNNNNSKKATTITFLNWYKEKSEIEKKKRVNEWVEQ